MAWKGHPPVAGGAAEEAMVVVPTGDDFDQDPNPYDFLLGVVGALMNVSDFETVLAWLESSHGFLVATAAPPEDGGDDCLFHEPMPYAARAGELRGDWGARKASVPLSAAVAERARRLNFMVALCLCGVMCGCCEVNLSARNSECVSRAVMSRQKLTPRSEPSQKRFENEPLARSLARPTQ